MTKRKSSKQPKELRPGCVGSKKAVAEALGVSSHTVQHWIGMPMEDDGSYDVEKIREWWNSKTMASRLKSKDRNLPSVGEIDATLKALKKAKAEVEKLFQFSRDVVATFRDKRGEILAMAQAADLRLQEIIRDTFTEEAVKGFTPSEKAKLFQILGIDAAVKYDKERLELGESTENVSVMVKHIKEIQQKRWAERGLVTSSEKVRPNVP